MIAVRSRPLQGLVWLAGALALGGCGPTEYRVNGSVTTEVGRRAQLGPHAPSVAVASLEGSPQPLTARFADDLALEARNRSITLADPKSARYLARGYLTAYAAPDGTELSYVWDVFDARERRARRVGDTVAVKGSADDPWSVIDDATLQVAAAGSADALADFLATTPESVAAEGAGPSPGDAGVTTSAQAVPPGSPPAAPVAPQPLQVTDAGGD